MNKGLKIFVALLGVVAAGGIADLSTNAVLSTSVAQQCGCGTPSCGGCLMGKLRPKRGGSDAVASLPCDAPDAGCQTCEVETPCEPVAVPEEPKCLYCELKTKTVEADKTCYKVEQKEVCVPAVRLPWMKDCPPEKSRVRTINVLKKHKSKKETTEYKWSVHEPEECDCESDAAASNSAPTPVTTSMSTYPDPMADAYAPAAFSDPAHGLGAVPRPPLESAH